MKDIKEKCMECGGRLTSSLVFCDDCREDRAFGALIVMAQRGIDPEVVKRRMDEMDAEDDDLDPPAA